MEVARYQFYFRSDQGIDSPDSPTYFKTYMTNTLTLKNPDNHFVLKVQQLSIPVTYYQFNVANQSSILRYSVLLGTSILHIGSITIPDGNYNVSQMGDQLTSMLAQSILAGVPSITACDIFWTYDSISNKFGMRFVGNLISGVAWQVYLSGDTILNALGFNYLSADWTVNDPYYYGYKQVNMFPLSQLYVVSDTLSDDESFQNFDDNTHQGLATHSSIIAVAQITCPVYTFFHYEFKNPIPVKIDRTSIEFLDFDLTDFFGKPLQGLTEPWNITFEIAEINTDAERRQTLRTFINEPPVPLRSVAFLENRSKNIDLNIANAGNQLELLKQQVNTSLENIRSDVQKRKVTDSSDGEIYQSISGTQTGTYYEPTIGSTVTGETKQATTDFDRSPKRQRET
jgi:hypothetical protein